MEKLKKGEEVKGIMKKETTPCAWRQYREKGFFGNSRMCSIFVSSQIGKEDDRSSKLTLIT